MITKTLDLGCGTNPKNPFYADAIYGVDIRSDLGSHVRPADLTVEPIPYDDASFDYLSAFEFIEHIPRVVYAPQRRNAFVEFMNEAYRVVKPGGYFLSSTPAYPHGEAFRDPTHVNIITEETFPLYFDDEHRWASMYGFTGAFRVVRHEWRGPNIHAVLRKVPVPRDAASPLGGKISILMPVHDGAPTLAPVLDALLAQTHTDFEILCIDDASADAGPAILEQYAARDARMRVLRTPSRLGTTAAALNAGLAQAGGAYVVHAPQDTLVSPDWLAQMHARAVATGADAVLSDRVVGEHRVGGLHGDRNVELSGRDALLHSLDGGIAGNALWNAELVRFLGFADFSANAYAYATRQLLLHACKVVFSAGTVFQRQETGVPPLTLATFDEPLTQLRLFQMLRTEVFPAEVQQQQAVKVVVQRNQLQQWLDEHGARSLAPEALQYARERLARITASMGGDPMFANVA